MLDDKKCILYVYKGQLGLPSLDYRCLQAIFTIKLKNSQKVEIRSSGFYITPNFPMLEYDGQFYSTQANILTKLEEIIEHSDTKHNVKKSRIKAYKALAYQSFRALYHWHSDTKHNVKKSRIKAYKALAYQSLEPCIILNFWGNEKNCQYLLKLYGTGATKKTVNIY
ncbi:hypothetical protein QE152_g543 [Popillia japonica]|uniref:Uncharacterized protein n=1 Tax=Popillia japonica TaxID=7064 RepID=A0AAW1NAC8_POPJA